MNFQKYDDIFDENNYPKFNIQCTYNQKKFIPDDNGACICLSGKKYKDCCQNDIKKAKQTRNLENVTEELNKLYLKKDNKLLSKKIEIKSINKKNIAYCSAQEIFCDCDKINSKIRSHTLSRGNILKNLANQNTNGASIISFNDHKIIDLNKIKNNIDDYYSDIKIQDASVNVSFCKKHDIELFSDIETDGKMEYINSDIQNLEYALKCVSFDVYYRIMNIKYMAELVKNNRNVVYEDNGQESPYFKNYFACQKMLFDIFPLMKKILTEIKDYKNLSKTPTLKTICFELPVHKINFSCAEVIDKWNTYCFVNTINSPKPYIIISYYEEKDNTIVQLDKLKETFEKNSSNKMNQIFCLCDFIMCLLSNAINIYFNKDAFNNLSDDEKKYLYTIHREGTIYIPDNIQKKYTPKLIKTLFSL